jgi:hypothetical protein
VGGNSEDDGEIRPGLIHFPAKPFLSGGGKSREAQVFFRIGLNGPRDFVGKDVGVKIDNHKKALSPVTMI